METKKTTGIDEYIAQYPASIQQRLALLRDAIREVVPDASEKISYGIPTFSLGKNLVHFAAFKSHIGVYALPHTHERFREELSGFKTGKGSVQFPHGEPLPVVLIKDMVRHRLRELQES